ncbi:hypothetical protein C8R45DRAFT_305835 [Mycena sanguinolenta]|nr:hypothetical protein C8R45DRAFT_305835 [Mycena sanguinolenta]
MPSAFVLFVRVESMLGRCKTIFGRKTVQSECSKSSIILYRMTRNPLLGYSERLLKPLRFRGDNFSALRSLFNSLIARLQCVQAFSQAITLWRIALRCLFLSPHSSQRRLTHMVASIYCPYVVARKIKSSYVFGPAPPLRARELREASHYSSFADCPPRSRTSAERLRVHLLALLVSECGHAVRSLVYADSRDGSYLNDAAAPALWLLSCPIVTSRPPSGI